MTNLYTNPDGSVIEVPDHMLAALERFLKPLGIQHWECSKDQEQEMTWIFFCSNNAELYCIEAQFDWRAWCWTFSDVTPSPLAPSDRIKTQMLGEKPLEPLTRSTKYDYPPEISDDPAAKKRYRAQQRAARKS